MVTRVGVAKTISILLGGADFEVPLLAVVIGVALTDQISRKVVRLFWPCKIYIWVLVEKMSKRSGAGFWLSNDKDID